MTSTMTGTAAPAMVSTSSGVGRFRAALAAAAVLILYSNIAVFLRLKGLSPIAPAVYVVAIGLLAAPVVAMVGNTWQVVWSPLSGWLAAYFALTAICFAATVITPGATEILFVMLQGMAYLAMALFLFADPLALRAARQGLIWCILGGVTLNIIDFTHPLVFSPLIGRAAGLYLNPNISAIALTLGMIAAIDEVRARYRTVFVLLVGVGVLLTLSRGGAAGFGVALLGLFLAGRLRWPRLVMAGVLLFLAVWGGILLAGAEETVAAGLQQLQGEQMGRLTGQVTDFGTKVRLDVARAGWSEFTSSPLLGAGIGRTFLWALPGSTHNMYLRGLAEMGILGGFAFPAAGLCAILGLPGDRKALGRVFLAVWLVLGMASHNMLEERPELTVLAMLAAEAIVARGRRTD